MLYFVTLAVFLFCFLNQVESVRLTISSPAVHIRVSSSVTLSCNIFELEDDFFSQDGSIVFIRHEKNVKAQLSYYTRTNFNTTSPRYKVSGIQRSDRYVVNLQMTAVVEEDASEYQCATYRVGALEMGSNMLQLKWIQTAPIEYPKCDAYMESNLLHLSCESANSVPSPSLIWFHNDDEVSRNTELMYALHSNKLVINRTDINGVYECRFYYVGGGINDERRCRIEKPNITVVSPADTEFINGSDAKITVLARAGPPMRTPLVCTWDHGKRVGFSVQTDFNDLAIITISNIDVTMNGSQITCCGRNFLGESCQVILVKTKPNKAESFLPNTELVIIVILGIAVVLLTAVTSFLCKKGIKKKAKSPDIISFEGEMRSPSFASTSTESQNSNADSGVNLHDVPCRLKRSTTVPSSRRLPAPPLSSLPQVHEYDRTSRNELTYSIIKTDQPPNLKESSLQPYMDMGGKKKPGKPSPTYSDEFPPYDNSTAEDGFIGSYDDTNHKGVVKDCFNECSSRVKDSPEKVGYLEVKKDPNSQCQYQDLEDLYRETASNNLYAP